MVIFPTKTIDQLDLNDPLSGTDLFLLVQGGVAKQVTLADLIAAVIAVLPSILDSNNTWTGNQTYSAVGTGNSKPAPYLSFLSTASDGTNHNDMRISESVTGDETTLRIGDVPHGAYVSIRAQDSASQQIALNAQEILFNAPYLQYLPFTGINCYSYQRIASEFLLVISNFSKPLVGFSMDEPGGTPKEVMYISNNPYDSTAAPGCYHSFRLQDSTNASQMAAKIEVTWTNSTHATRAARLAFFAFDANAQECIRIESVAALPAIGFYGTAAVVQPPAVPAPVGGAVIDVQARAAIALLINLLSAAAGGNGLTA